MARLLLKSTNRADADAAVNDPKWHTYAEDDGGGAVEFLVPPWGRTVKEELDRLASDKDYIASLNIDWDLLPIGTGKKKIETRTIVLADYLIKGWRNVVAGPDKRPLECTLVNKVWALEAEDVGNWLLARSKEGTSQVIEDDTKNS